MGEKPVTKFPDRVTAERRVSALLARLHPASGPFSRTPVRAHSEGGNVAQRVRDIIGLAHKAHAYGIRVTDDGRRIVAYK